MMESKWGEVRGREKGRESGAHKGILLIIYEDEYFVSWFENEGQFVHSPISKSVHLTTCLYKSQTQWLYTGADAGFLSGRGKNWIQIAYRV